MNEQVLPSKPAIELFNFSLVAKEVSKLAELYCQLSSNSKSRKEKLIEKRINQAPP